MRTGFRLTGEAGLVAIADASRWADVPDGVFIVTPREFIARPHR